MFQESFQCVSKVFERSSQGIPEVSKACQGCFKDQGSFRSVPRKLVGCFKEVLMVFQGRLNGDLKEWVSMVFKRSSMGI